MNTDGKPRRWALALLLLFAVQVGRAQAVEVRVEGLGGELRDNVRAALGIARLDAGAPPAVVRDRHGKAPAEIARALEPFGYYRPRVGAELQEPQAAGEGWIAHYRVDRGPALPVADVAVAFTDAGATDAALAELIAALPLRQGERLDHREYERAKRELLQSVQRRGYRDARYAVHRVEVDLESYEARVVLRVNTGRRYVIGPVRFAQTGFDEAYLERYLLLRPGEAYNSLALADQRQALSRSGHFREVEIEPQPPSAEEPGVIPLVIHLQPYLPNRYRGRLGWGTETGVGAQLDWVRRYVGGRGQHFNLGLALVEERRRLAGDLNYVIPLDPLEGSRLTLGARHESKDLTYEDVDLTEGGETRIATNLLSATWQRPGWRWGGFEVIPRAGVSLVTETYDVFEVLFGNLPEASQDILIDEVLGREAYDILTPDFEAVVPRLRLQLRRGDPLFIRSGDYFELELLGADESLGSNISFWQARLDTWHIRSLGERSRLLLRTEMGYSEAESSEVLGVNFNAMPEYYEFRAGGVRSVRGYAYEALLPDDAITGGKHELVASAEYEYEVVPDWSVAAFVDGGNAFNRWEDYDPKVGVGLGLRWRSPVGLARIDVGVPLDDADDSFQFYITVGPEF